MPYAFPHISVAIPTCNRSEDIQRCLDSLVKVVYPNWDILLVDQSDDERTRTVVEHFTESLPQLTYKRIDEKGTARARNIGIEATSGEIVAYLDDDCTVKPDWLKQVADAFERHPKVALVFGNVASAPYDPREFFVPVYPVKREHIIRSPWAFARPDGMGASMYLRRTVWQQVGPFDVCLGPGSRWYWGGEDNDYIYRCLVSGFDVMRTPAIAVEHYGARSYENGGATRLFVGNAQCAAAIDMKLMRCGHPIALLVMASHSAYFVLEIFRRGPRSINQLLAYVRSLYGSFELGVDRRRGLFVQR